MDAWQADKIRTAINDFMQRRGLRPARWAKQADLDDSTLRKFLDGATNSLQLDTIYRLAHAIGATVSEVIGEAPATKNPSFDPPILFQLISELEAYLKRHGRKLNPDRKAHIIVEMYRDYAGKPAADISMESRAEDIKKLSQGGQKK
jgi:hypothetical protein